MRTLLLADDNVIVQRVIKLTFAQEPVRVVTASDGHQAMDRVVVERPDIVLAGTTLPQVNGYELAKFVKSKAELGDVPVLLLSGAFETVDETALRSSGANGVIEKPVEPALVISRVKELLGIRTAEDTAHPSPLPTTPPVVTTLRPRPAVDRRAETNPAEPAPLTGDDDYLASLESAFDSLDQQLAGKPPASRARPPAPSSQPGNPVYEIDEAWFAASEATKDDGVLRVDSADAAGEASPPVFEIDDQWFADSERATDAPVRQPQELAREMGVHDLDVTSPAGAAPAGAAPVDAPPPASAVPAASPALPADVAVDFAALLAFEQGEPISPDIFEPATAAAAAPEITPAMLDRIADAVTARLTEVVRESVSAAVRDAVRDVVLDTSERLVREEIERIKSKQP